MASNETILNGKVLYKSDLHLPVHDLLSSLDEGTIFAIAATASGKKVLPTDKAEAIDTIMLFTQDVERLFSYKKITSLMLTLYLHKHNETVQANLSKINLISKVLTLWKNKHYNVTNGDEVQNTEQQEPQTISQASGSSRKSEVSLIPTVRSDEFSKRFVTWFYSTVNALSESSEVAVTSNMFCENATVDVFFVMPSGEEASHAEGSIECANSLHQIVLERLLVFNPNLDSGVQAVKSPHGLVRIFCCGSLHQGDTFVGIFEQEFGLCQNPVDKRWQIFVSKVNLKGSIYQVPSLPTVELFQIEGGP